MTTEHLKGRACLLATIFCLAALAATASAQDEPSPLVGLVAGQMRYRDLAARTGLVIAVRVGSPFIPFGGRNWLLEGSADYSWYRNDRGQLHHLAVSELQLQLHPGPHLLEPYAGLGGGAVLTRGDSTLAIHLTASASLGLRLGAVDSWGLVGELRLRALDLFRGTTREVTVGAFRHLP